MNRPSGFPSHSRRLGGLLACLLAVQAASMVPAQARPGGPHAIHGRHLHGLNASLLRCTSLRRPSRSGRFAGSRQDQAAARRPGFAPTRQAVFFSHAGDRCIWHAGAPARG